jgi:hypothetical protein
VLLLAISGHASALHKAEKGAEEDAAADSELAPPGIMPEYSSPLPGFRKFRDADGADWKGANDTVGEIGGWRTYAREAFESQANEPEGNEEDDSGKKEESGDKP